MQEFSATAKPLVNDNSLTGLEGGHLSDRIRHYDRKYVKCNIHSRRLLGNSLASPPPLHTYTLAFVSINPIPFSGTEVEFLPHRTHTGWRLLEISVNLSAGFASSLGVFFYKFSSSV